MRGGGREKMRKTRRKTKRWRLIKMRRRIRKRR